MKKSISYFINFFTSLYKHFLVVYNINALCRVLYYAALKVVVNIAALCAFDIGDAGGARYCYRCGGRSGLYGAAVLMRKDYIVYKQIVDTICDIIGGLNGYQYTSPKELPR